MEIAFEPPHSATGDRTTKLLATQDIDGRPRRKHLPASSHSLRRLTQTLRHVAQASGQSFQASICNSPAELLFGSPVPFGKHPVADQEDDGLLFATGWR
jgi:hypothetical protein